MSGRLHVASSSAARLAHVTAFIGTQPPQPKSLLVAANRGAADDVARHVARNRPATFGLHRFSLTQLAARLAATRLAGTRVVPATRLATEAVAARAVFEARRDERLAYFVPVAGMPGFAPSLGRTLTDLRMASADTASLSAAGEGGPGPRDPVRSRGGTIRGRRHGRPCGAVRGRDRRARERHGVLLRRSVALIDVAVTSEVERRFVAALVGHGAEWIAVAPTHDDRTNAALGQCGEVIVET